MPKKALLNANNITNAIIIFIICLIYIFIMMVLILSNQITLDIGTKRRRSLIFNKLVFGNPMRRVSE